MALLLAELTEEKGGVLECRAWICRVLFARAAEPDFGPELAALEVLWRQKLAQHVDRIGSGSLGGVGRDPLSGALQQTYVLYLHLRDPHDDSQPDAARVEGADCPQQLARVRAAVEALGPRHERALPPRERHRRAPSVDGAATAIVSRELSRALGPELAALQVDCRAGFCRIDLRPGHALTWARFDERLRASARASELLPASWRGAGGERYFRLGARPETQEVSARTAASRAFSAAFFALVKSCNERHPGGGRVQAKVLIPAAGELNLDGEEDRPSFRFTGPGADAPHGRCVREGIPRTLESAPLPTGHRREMTFQFIGSAPAP